MQGNIAEIWVAIFSLGSCVLFIVDTYMVATPIELFIMELIFSWLFFFQFFVDLCCAKQRLEFLYSRDALVDIITVTPILIMAFTSTYNPIHTGENSSTGFLRFTRVVKVTRVFRLIRLLKVVRVVASPIEDAIRMKTTELASLVISLVIITAGIVQFLAQNFGSDWGGCEPTVDQPVCPDLSFHDAFYFTVVTMSSVGYGDISPKDVVGRMCMVVMIVFALVVVLPKVDELSNILSFRSRYGGTVKGSKDLAMVLLGCDPGNGRVSERVPQRCLKFLGHT
jgi:voltage-gated potassium channel